MKNCVFSICSGNYLPQIAVLFESLRQFVPENTRILLALTERSNHPSVDAAKRCGGDLVWTIEQFGVESWESMAFYYDITELNTAVKPSIIRSLFAQEYDKVVYFDPDIVVYQPLEKMFEMLEADQALITPHVCSPIIEDGLSPKMEDLLHAGQFNLGFIALRRTSQVYEFISWWEQVLKYKALSMTNYQLFYDQFWAAALPSLVDSVRIVRHEGWNMAYWNLQQRELKEGVDGWTTRDGLLMFFHFSGFDFSDITRWTNHSRRIVVDEGSSFWKLGCQYRDSVAKAREILGSEINAPYSFGSFNSGEPILKEHRQLYLSAIEREAAMENEPFSINWSSPSMLCLFVDCKAENSRIIFRGWKWNVVPEGREVQYRACLDCGCIHADPFPNQQELSICYQSSFDYDAYLKRRMLKKCQAWHRWFRVRKWLHPDGLSKGRLLDIGCGHGWFAEVASHAGWSVIGLDFPGSALEYAKKQLGLAVHASDLNNLDPPKGLFDVITIWHCLEHLIDPRSFLHRIRQIVRPGGRIVIAVPNRAAMGIALRGVHWVWIQSAILHIWHFSPPALERLLIETGWTVERMDTRETWDANLIWDGLFAKAVHRGIVLPTSILISRIAYPDDLLRREDLKHSISLYFSEILRLIAYFPVWTFRPLLRRLLRNRGSELMVVAKRES